MTKQTTRAASKPNSTCTPLRVKTKVRAGYLFPRLVDFESTSNTPQNDMGGDY